MRLRNVNSCDRSCTVAEGISQWFSQMKPDRVFFIWALWVSFIVATSIRFRFWINSDTVGSIDSARALQALDIPNFINAYWGIGLAAFLSFLPLERPSSWLAVHLVVGALLLVSQVFLYAVTRSTGLNRGQATGVAMAWGLSCYATGSAVFVTADLALCFFAAAYLLLAFRTAWDKDRIPKRSALGLGLLHGFAGLTKTIAFPSLLIFPAVSFLLDTISMFRRGPSGPGFRVLFRKWGLFLLCYASVFLFLLIPWGMLTEGKYGRFTLGDSASYNHSKYIRGDEEILSSERDARFSLPSWGSYWWSDLALTVERSDRNIEFDLGVQVKRIGHNIRQFVSGGRQLRDGWPSLVVIAVVIPMIVIWWRDRERSVPIALGLAGIATIFAYLGSVFLCRYFPYATLLAIPMATLLLGPAASRLTRKLATAFLWLWILHGSGATLAAFWIAPGPEHFEAAQLIATESNGPIAVICETGISYSHYGGVALVAGKPAAEAYRVAPGAFQAEFEPGVVLWLSPSPLVPEELLLNGTEFFNRRVWRQESGSQPTRWFAVYLPRAPTQIEIVQSSDPF